MSSIPGQIFESIEELGKAVATETVKVPKEIAGKALESLGTSQSQGGKSQQTSAQPSEKSRTQDAWDTFDQAGDTKVKKAIAREALAALLRRSPQKESSVWERAQKEAEDAKKIESAKKGHISSQVLPQTSQKRPRGDLYGIKTKRAAAEMSRNVRQD